MNLKCANVRDTGEEFVVRLPTTKNKEPKTYVIDGEFTNIFREYIALRPRDATTDRFFLQYRNGRCINQVIGKNSIAKFPKEIAKFLQLDDPESYTGHAYRRTGTTIAAESGANSDELMRMGPWKSRAVCEKYIKQSVGYKKTLGRMITGAIKLPSTVTEGSVAKTATNAISANYARPIMPVKVGNDLTMGRVMPSSLSADFTSPIGGLSESISCVRKITESLQRQPMHSATTSVDSDDKTSNSSGVLSQSNSVGINVPDNKNNIILHFGGECSKFTIINMK